MPRLARWDDSFEFEDVPELVAIFHSGTDEELWPENPQQGAPPEPCVEVSDEGLDELIAEIRAVAQAARRSPASSGLGH